MVWKRLIGSDTTNENGVASVTYTGKGYGLIDVVASVSSDLTGLCSDEKEILDCIFYDEATSNAKANQYSNENSTYLTPTYSENGTKIECSATSGTYQYYTKIGGITQWNKDSNFQIELDYSYVNGTGATASFTFGNNRVSFATLTSGTSKTSGHLTIISNNRSYICYNNGVQIGGERVMTDNSGLRFTFYKECSITFKNLKIYPI